MPLPPVPLTPGDVQLWLLTSDAAPVPDRALAMLDAEERLRADRFKRARDRASFIRAHAFLRGLLGHLTGEAPDRIAIITARGGKPHLARQDGPQFSLSHSGDHVLVGLATDPVGVDVEAVRPIPDHRDIARRFFAPGEQSSLAALADKDQEQAFFACWTRKEAFVKALGTGLSHPLDRFTVSVDPRRPAALLAVEGDANPALSWSMWGERVAAEAWAAAVVRRPDARFILKPVGPAEDWLRRLC